MKARASCAAVLSLWMAAVLLAGENASSSEPTSPPTESSQAAASAATLTAIEFEEGTSPASVLRGPDASRQLIVKGVLSTGEAIDATRAVEYTATPAGVVDIDPTGHVRPLADGQATITAFSAGGVEATTTVAVEHYSDPPPINFPNQIVPIFTKWGCNGGGCHGKSGGQNGFRLSLLGFEPAKDYEYLVKEGRGRRLFPAAPEQSLLLTKPTNVVPHGGGHRFDVDSHDYRVLRRWISQGMPYGSSNDPVVERIEVVPESRMMTAGGEQQIAVLAYYTDGTVEDITRVAQYDPNNTEMAEVTVTGLVKTMDVTGDVAIMARYSGHVATFRATLPLGAEVDSVPVARNFIDEHVFAKLEVLGMPPSKVCDDSTFIRRVTLDIAGRLPTKEETAAFLADPNSDKRDRAIDRLLASNDYADFFANKWNAILRNRPTAPTHTHGARAFHDWIRTSFHHNKPYDQFVREIIAASGDPAQHPAALWYRQVNTVEQQVEDCAQLFLGTRIQCARCHHHPFEKWSERDYYSLAAFFSRIGRKPAMNPDEMRIFHQRGQAAAKLPKTGETLKPAGLDGEPVTLSPEDDPRHALADWMSKPDNPLFAKALVNRYWKHFFARGLVEPEDDLRATNPPSNPELFDALAKHFVESGFDLKDLIRTICQSTTYQLSSAPNEHNLADKQNYSRYYPKRLSAEVLLDSLDEVLGTSTAFAGLPPETRAVELPETTAASYFLTVFGRPQGTTACECERSPDANLAQSLHLLNSAEIQTKLSSAEGRAAVLAKDEGRKAEDKIRELYLVAFSREPTADELEPAIKHIESSESKQQAYEDILWALVNTKEFLFNH